MSLEQVIFLILFCFVINGLGLNVKAAQTRLLIECIFNASNYLFIFYIKTSTNAPKIQTTVTIRPLVPIPEDLMSALVNKDIVEMASTVQVC